MPTHFYSSSNPPYVTDSATAQLPPEFLHEPRAAFAAGADGLDFVRRIFDAGRAHLTAGGGFLIEGGASRKAEVEKQLGRNFEFTWLPTSVGVEDVYFARERTRAKAQSRKAETKATPQRKAKYFV